MRPVPLVGRINPIARWIAVLLPAPFEPRNPKISPVSTVREKSSKARRPRLLSHPRYSFVILSNSRTEVILNYSNWLFMVAIVYPSL